MPTFQTADPVSATIDVVAGDVRIRAGDRDDHCGRGPSQRPGRRRGRQGGRLTRVEYADGNLLVKAPKLRSWLPRRDGGSIDVTIELPAGSDVRGTVQLGGFDCAGRLGDCRIKTGLGHHPGRQRGHAESEDRHRRHQRRARDGRRRGDRRLRRRARPRARRQRRDQELERRHWVGVAGRDLRVSAANGDIAVDRACAGVVGQVVQRRRPRGRGRARLRRARDRGSASSRSGSPRGPPRGSTCAPTPGGSTTRWRRPTRPPPRRRRSRCAPARPPATSSSAAPDAKERHDRHRRDRRAQVVRPPPGPRRHRPRCRRGHDLRAARPQRRGEEHARPHPVDLDPARRRRRARGRARRRRGSRTRSAPPSASRASSRPSTRC